MPQERLDIFFRTQGPDEIAHAKKVKNLEGKIREERRSLQEKKAELEERQQRQRKEGLQFGETRVTAQLIQKLCKPVRAHIKKLEHELVELKQQAGAVQREASKQQYIFES